MPTDLIGRHSGLCRFGDFWWIVYYFVAYVGVLDWCSLDLGGAC